MAVKTNITMDIKIDLIDSVLKISNILIAKSKKRIPDNNPYDILDL
tara:strand:- start:4650 stop:4787 length:138 start_codon:yes stop_codon:yes gene_type:complete